MNPIQTQNYQRFDVGLLNINLQFSTMVHNSAKFCITRNTWPMSTCDLEYLENSKYLYYCAIFCIIGTQNCAIVHNYPKFSFEGFPDACDPSMFGWFWMLRSTLTLVDHIVAHTPSVPTKTMCHRPQHPPLSSFWGMWVPWRAGATSITTSSSPID